MSRTIGSITLDDGVNGTVQEVNIPSTRVVQLVQIVNRQGRVTRIKEDRNPLVIDVRGTWADGGGKYWRDFKAALLNQSRAAFTLGDGTRFEMVDVTEVVDTKLAQVGALTATPGSLYAYTMKVASYEPYTRDVGPSLVSLGAVSSGPTNPTTTFTVSYPGTAFAETTAQLTLVVQGGNAVQQVALNNTTTGELCTVAGLNLTTGTWYVLIDASGSTVPPLGAVQSPNNNAYGVLAVPSVGYGVTIALMGGGSFDIDFVGRPITLAPSTTPNIPPTPNTNTIVASISSTSALTSASLGLLAPSRWYR